MNTVRRGKRQVKGEEPKRVTLADFALHAPVDTLVESDPGVDPFGVDGGGGLPEGGRGTLGGGALPSWGRLGRSRAVGPSARLGVFGRSEAAHPGSSGQKSPHRPGGAAGDVHAHMIKGARRIVSPARAGMDPRSSASCVRLSGFPRTRGDGPVTYHRPCVCSLFPPHARGWTVQIKY